MTQPDDTQPVKADIEALLVAIACMAERMATSLQLSGLAIADGKPYMPHLNASNRRRTAMYRLIDALHRAQGEQCSLWRLKHTLAVIAEHKRNERRAATKGA